MVASTFFFSHILLHGHFVKGYFATGTICNMNILLQGNLVRRYRGWGDALAGSVGVVGCLTRRLGHNRDLRLKQGVRLKQKPGHGLQESRWSTVTT